MADLKKALSGIASSTDRIAAFDAAEEAEVEAVDPIDVADPQVVEEGIGMGVPAFNSADAAKRQMLLNRMKALKARPDLQARIALQIKAMDDAARALAAE